MCSTWDIPCLINDLADYYRAEGKEQYYDGEKSSVELRLHALKEALSFRYCQPKIIGLGGSGIVLQLTDNQLSGRSVALKIPRPVPGQVALLNAMLHKEASSLVKLRHPSIVRIHAHGWVNISEPPDEAPYYIMDYVEGDNSSKYFKCTIVDDNSFILLLERLIDAVAYLHDNNIAHLDIKSGNILIDANLRPVIADLGTAKTLKDDPADTAAATTKSVADPEFLRWLGAPTEEEERKEGSLPRSEIKLIWDLMPLGFLILNWLGYNEYGYPLPRKLTVTSYTRKFLWLMAGRLTRGKLPSGVQKIGLSPYVFEELKYQNSNRVLQDIQKLSGTYSLTETIPEINIFSMKTLQVAREMPTPLTETLTHILELPCIDRLSSISQLGLVLEVYYTARHDRLSHTLGTYHNTVRYIHHLYNDPLSPFFRQVMTADDIRALLLAALLHDVAHYPLAHDLEDIDEKFFSHEKRMHDFLEKNQRNLERKRLPTGPYKFLYRYFIPEYVWREWRVSPKRVLNILRAKPRRASDGIKDRILHTIIDGPIDADKLDYLLRDSSNLQVPYPQGIDVERLLRGLTVFIDERSDGPPKLVGIAVHEKAKVPAEALAFARYAMFSQVYWQHTSRALKAMLSRAIWPLLAQLSSKSQDLKQFKKQFNEYIFAVSEPRQKEPADLFKITDASPENIRHKLVENDVRMLQFFAQWLSKLSRPEAQLINDILDRRLYKRLFVFSSERNKDDWRQLIKSWDRLKSAHQRCVVHKKLDEYAISQIANKLDSDPPTETIDGRVVKEVTFHVRAERPLLIVDIPEARGTDSVLYYVVEAQRRSLRKDERVVGDAEQSSVWKYHADNLHERAGKIRIFCHPNFVDAVESSVKRQQFLDKFSEIVDAVIDEHR